MSNVAKENAAAEANAKHFRPQTAPLDALKPFLTLVSTDSNALCNFFNLALTRVAGVTPRTSTYDDTFKLIGLQREDSLASALFPPGILLDQGPVLAGAVARFWPVALRARYVAAVERALSQIDARVGQHAVFVINAVYGR